MAGMSKGKRPKQARDYHQSTTMVRLADDVAIAMKALAAKNDRALAREVRRAIIAHLEREGMWPAATST